MKIRISAAVSILSLCALAMSAQVLVDSNLQAKLGTVGSATQPLRVVVTFDHPPSIVDQTIISGVASRFTMLSKLPMALIETNAAGVQRLSTTAGIKSLYLDKQLKYFLHESVPLIQAPQAWAKYGADGHGVGVAIIDSGIDGTHPDLPYPSHVVQNVKIAGVSASDSPTGTGVVKVIENLPSSDTFSGHGTHCAGIVGGLGIASKTNSANDVGGHGYYTGVAPGANLIGVGTGDVIFVFYALEGFDWVMSHRAQYNIKVVSNSWGNSPDANQPFDPNDPINVASKVAHDAGITVCFAAGNDGPGTDTLNPYSVAPWVIGVAAGNKDGATLADFSSRGRFGDAMFHPTITAPGAGIISTRAPNTSLPLLGPAEGDADIQPQWIPYYTTMSGTSMATPHVAGVCALLYSSNKFMSPDVIKRIIGNTATPMPLYKEYASGAGYINAYAAVDAAKRFKLIKWFKDPRSGKTIQVYVTEQTFTGSVGPAAASYNSQLATTAQAFTLAPNALFLDTQLQWDQFANDLDLFLFRDDGTGTYAQQGASQNIQAVTLTAREGVPVDYPAAGNWRAEVRGWLNAPQSYTLTVQQYFPLQ
jgi:serine protease AprX